MRDSAVFPAVIIVVSADLRLAEGSASAQPSMCPCSIKRCQFPRVSAYALTINKTPFTAPYDSVSAFPIVVVGHLHK